MAGITSFEDGDQFIYRVYSDQGTTQGPRWSNTFEAYAHASGTVEDLKTLGLALSGLVTAMTGLYTRITNYTISTWVPDSTPYDPENFYVSPALGLEGTRVVVAPLALDVCLDLRRSVALGRSGNIYLRAGLGEEDVERAGSGFMLTDQAGMEAELAVALAATHVPYYYLGGSMVPLWLGMIGANIIGTVHRRALTAITVRGATIVPMNHRWYNQPNRTAFARARRLAVAEVKLEKASDPFSG